MRLLAIALLVAIPVSSARADKTDGMPQAEVQYPTPYWIPWTVAGSGLAVTLTGLVLYKVADNHMEDADARFAAECAMGCTVGQADGYFDDAQREHKISVGLLVGGAVATVAGTVWAAVNKPYIANVQVAPTDGGASASVRMRF